MRVGPSWLDICRGQYIQVHGSWHPIDEVAVAGGVLVVVIHSGDQWSTGAGRPGKKSVIAYDEKRHHVCDRLPINEDVAE